MALRWIAIAAFALLIQISSQVLADGSFDASSAPARLLLQTSGKSSGEPKAPGPKPSNPGPKSPKKPAGPTASKKKPDPKPKKPAAPKPPKKPVAPKPATEKPAPPKAEAPATTPSKWPAQRPASKEPINPYPGGIAPGFAWSPKAKDPKVLTVSVGYGTGYTHPVPAVGVDALPQVQAALKELAKAKGGILKIGAGTFVLSDKFRVLSNNTWIHGAGMNETVLRLGDKSKPWQSSGFLRAIRTENVTLSDITLDGNKYKQINGKVEGYGKFCIYLVMYRNWKFDSVRCTRWLRYGFDPHGKKPADNDYKKAVWGYGLTVVNSMSDQNNWDGFTLDQTYFVYAARNFAAKNGRYGFNIVTGSRHVIIEDNVAVDDGFGSLLPEWEFSGGSGCGFQVDTNIEELYGFETYNVTLRNNLAINAFRAGFCVKDQRFDGTKIYNNRVTHSGACGNWKRVKYTTFKNNICGPGNKANFTAETSDPNFVTYVGNTFLK